MVFVTTHLARSRAKQTTQPAVQQLDTQSTRTQSEGGSCDTPTRKILLNFHILFHLSAGFPARKVYKKKKPSEGHQRANGGSVLYGVYFVFNGAHTPLDGAGRTVHFGGDVLVKPTTPFEIQNRYLVIRKTTLINIMIP
jgi:hypothetical protein